MTLAELVVSASVMVVITGGMASAVVIASRAIDDGTNPATVTADGADVVGEVAAELGFALDFSELTSTAVTFTVPDRDGDGSPEEVRYAWSGTAGDPLTRSYNGATAINLVEAVDKFGVQTLTRKLYPLPQACCNSGACTDESMESCLASGGEAIGPGTTCATVTCPTERKLLFVTANADVAILSAQELARIALLESWGFTVDYVAAADTQGIFDAAVAVAMVAYVNSEIDSKVLVTKLSSTSIGVVIENEGSMPDFGFGTQTGDGIGTFEIAANDHYVTESFGVGPLVLFNTSQEVTVILGGTEPIGGLMLGWADPFLVPHPSLITVETAAQLSDGSPAPGRRVKLPWGAAAFVVGELNADGQTLMQRAVEWSAGLDSGTPSATICGDSICAGNEDACNCPDDCGAPPSFEQPGATCTDGLDNDCDGAADCVDLNCSSDPACGCGNGKCDTGENCYSCSSDCASTTSGKPASQHCCGNGVLEAAEGDGSICDFNP